MRWCLCPAKKNETPCRPRDLHSGALRLDLIATPDSLVLTDHESVGNKYTARIPHGLKNSKASGLPAGWDEIMNHSSGTRHEPRHHSLPSLALIILSLARAVVGPAEPL